MFNISKRKLSLVTLLSITLVLGALPDGFSGEQGAQQIQSYSDAMMTLKQKSAVQQALRHIAEHDRQTIDDMIILSEIPAPPFKEQKRAAKFAQMLRDLGLSDVTIDNEGNVLARRKGRNSAHTVAIVAHLDTVFPEGTDVRVKVDGNLYTAPGIGDNARGLAVITAMVRALRAASIKTDGDILFVGSVGEEGLGDLRGVKYLLREGGPGIDSFIGIDGGANRLVYGAVGSYRYRVTFRGPGGHSWGAFGTVNPHHALGRAMEKMAVGGENIYATGPKVSISVGRIGGGTSINSIPFESWMEVDMRSATVRKLDEMDRMFKQAVLKALDEENTARREGPPLTVEIDNIGLRPAGKGDVKSALVQRAMAAMSLLGTAPELVVSSTDANIAISKGMPAITMSRGGINKASHSLHESWQNTDGHIAIQSVLLTALAEAGVL